MDPLTALAHQRELIIIEDCAQAHGASYGGKPVGNLGSHAGAFSFCQDKILPLGEGGMLVLDDDEAFKRAWSYRDHGKSFDKVQELAHGPNDGSFKWLIDSFGSNWRMPEVTGAIGRVGLVKLPEWHLARTRHANQLADALSTVKGLRVPVPADDTVHAFYRLYGYIEPELLSVGWTRDRVLAAILAEGVACQYGTCAEIYREQAFVRSGLAPNAPLPNAREIHETALAFFVHPTLQEADISDTIAAVQKVMEAATG
jgi:dTDP-4-amino-4,6-dideoxygalactose transaminase